MADTPNLDPDKVRDTIRQTEVLNELYSRSVDLSVQQTINARDFTQELREVLKIKTKINDYDKSIIDIGKKVVYSVQLNNTELRRSEELTRRLKNDKKALSEIEREIRIVGKSSNLGTEQALGLANKLSKVENFRTRQLDKVLDLERFAKAATGDRKRELEGQLNKQSLILQKAELYQRKLEQGLSTDDKKIVYLNRIKLLQEENIKNREAEYDVELKIKDVLGISGALIDNINKIGARFFGGIGVNLGVFASGLAEAKEEADKLAETLALDKADNRSRFTKRIEVMKVMMRGVRSAFFSALSDPLTIAVALVSEMVKGFNAVDKEATEFQRNVGRTADIQASLNTRFASAVDYYKQLNSLVQSTGLQADLIFSKDLLANGAELVNTIGFTNEEMSKLITMTQVNNRNLDESVDSILNTVSGFNASRKTAISQGLVLKDIAKTTYGITASLKSNPEQLALAAASARRLGLELSKIESIADSLIQFESSIEAELEAQLLTGKDINLSKARELSLNNDLLGVSEEIFKNSADLLEFSNYNRIAQDAYAKSLGLSRDELAKIAYQRGLELGLSEEALQKATALNAEEFRRMQVTDSIAKSMEKLAQTFAPLIAFAAEYAEIILGTLIAYQVFSKTSKVIAMSSAISAASEAAKVASLTNQNRLLVAQNVLKSRGMASDTASMVASVIANPIKAIAGLALAGIATAAVFAAMRQVQDARIDSQGGLIVAGPKGTYKLDKDDSVVVGTDLGKKTDSELPTKQTVLQSVTINTQKFDQYARENVELNRRLSGYLEQLVELGKKPSNVYIDGNKAGMYIKMAESITS